MSAPVLEDARRRFGDYALDYVLMSRQHRPVTAAEMAQISQTVRDIENHLAQLASFTIADDPNLPQLIEQARALRSGYATFLAVAGLDRSRAQGEREVLILSERDSADLVQALLEPPEPNDALRHAFKDYRRVIGL